MRRARAGKGLWVSLLVLLTACAPSEAAIATAIAQTQAAATDTPGPTRTTWPTPTALPGIGISRRVLQSALERKGFVFEQGSWTVRGQPRVVGKYGYGAEVELIGPPEYVMEASMTIWPENMDRFTPSFPTLIELVAPDWGGFLDWVYDTRYEDVARITVGHLQVELTCVRPFEDVWFNTLTVKARE